MERKLASYEIVALLKRLCCKKQQPEVFYKKRCSLKFRKIHKKLPVQESLFFLNCRPEVGNFIKKATLAQAFSYEFCEISKNTFFTEHLWGTAFELSCNRR